MKPGLANILVGSLCGIIGTLVGVMTAYWKLKDRMEETIREEVAIERRLTDLENATEKNRENIYLLQTTK